jgi:hypothetical protein
MSLSSDSEISWGSDETISVEAGAMSAASFAPADVAV